MCGRYVLSKKAVEIAEELGIPGSGNFQGSSNIAPSEKVPVVSAGEDGLFLQELSWGYKPNWGSGPKFLINLKAETVLEKKFASAAFKNRRCVLPADGFYEWKQEQGKNAPKTPFYFSGKNSKLLGLGGLIFKGGSGKDECLVLTVSANPLVEDVHHRMPFLLEPGDWAAWVRDPDYQKAYEMVRPFPADKMSVRQASTLINNARYKGDPFQEQGIAN